MADPHVKQEHLTPPQEAMPQPTGCIFIKVSMAVSASLAVSALDGCISLLAVSACLMAVSACWPYQPVFADIVSSIRQKV